MNKKWIAFVLILVFSFGGIRVFAHSLPDSKAQLYINRQKIMMKISTPLEIIEVASKIKINLSSKTSVDSLKNYYLQHIFVTDTLHSQWKISVGDIVISDTQNQIVGKYRQISSEIILVPSNPNSLQDFVLHCDLITHQIPNQSILFSIEQDWQNGLIQNQNSSQIGIIGLDIPTGKILPLHIVRQEGNNWKGFVGMLQLGIEHIAEGTDHLLFLLVLLLPVPLVASQKRWTKAETIKTSIFHILKVITAFTIGHSITLLIGAMGWSILPSQWIEILIGFSILISAIHAIRPLFAGKEAYIAFSFGLIHGLAFANSLQLLQLDTSRLVLSIFGFNLGIEIMQLLVILCTIPWLLLMSRTSYYAYFRIMGAIFGGIAACAWMIERYTQHSNPVASLLENLSTHAFAILLVFISFAVFTFGLERRKLLRE